MSTNSSLDRLLDRVEPGRRKLLRKVLEGAVAGTVVCTAPLMSSFSMHTLGGVAHAQVSNQFSPPVPTPTTSGWGIAALVGMLSAVGAFLVHRRRRDRQP